MRAKHTASTHALRDAPRCCTTRVRNLANARENCVVFSTRCARVRQRRTKPQPSRVTAIGASLARRKHTRASQCDVVATAHRVVENRRRGLPDDPENIFRGDPRRAVAGGDFGDARACCGRPRDPWRRRRDRRREPHDATIAPTMRATRRGDRCDAMALPLHARGSVHGVGGNLRAAFAPPRERPASPSGKPAPKEQPPRKLSGKRTAASAEHIWKVDASASAEGVTLSGASDRWGATPGWLSPGWNVPRLRCTHPRIVR